MQISSHSQSYARARLKREMVRSNIKFPYVNYKFDTKVCRRATDGWMECHGSPNATTLLLRKRIHKLNGKEITKNIRWLINKETNEYVNEQINK